MRVVVPCVSFFSAGILKRKGKTMEEITENVLFDRQLPCVVCGLPTNCGTAISAEVKGLEDYDFKGTWVIYPICERNTGCRERMQDAGMIPKPGEKLTLHQNNVLVEGKDNN